MGSKSYRGGLRAIIGSSVVLLGVLWAASASAASGRADYDLDDDGLIEIDDLDDLDQMRLFPLGNALYDESVGCPLVGCRGFELTTDLDFDTDADGDVDLDDAHFTDLGSGQGGWLPIALLVSPFEGNNHVIRNLTSIGVFTGPADFLPQGLFQELIGATIRNLRFENVFFRDFYHDTGVLAGIARGGTIVQNVSVVGGSMRVNNFANVGGLIGSCEASLVEESYTSLPVRADHDVGGLIGRAIDCSIARSFVLGKITADRYGQHIGGLVGTMSSGSIEDSFVSGSVGEGFFFGGLIGSTESPPTIENTYMSGAVIGSGSAGGGMLGFGDATFVSSFFATDTTGYNKTKTGGEGGAVAVTLADLQCPDAPSDPDCVPGLFAGWQTRLNSDGEPAWDLGSSQEVPALRIDGIVYRDSDGDGLLDDDDEFPFDWEASVDTDNDGAIDFWRDGCSESCRSASSMVLDQFPGNPAAALDLDLDGRPDAWNPSCNATCQSASGLTLDTSPGDFDDDGITDLSDQDDDGDGVADVDLDSDNLIDVSTLAHLAQIHFDTTGASLWSEPAPDAGLLDDVSGCRPRIVRGILARECDGYELLSDLDFDTNGDGVLDAIDDAALANLPGGDSFPPPWDPERGWRALGHHGDVPSLAFQTTFEGNGHVIRNLYVNNFGGLESGLFGGVRGASIRNLGVVGELASVSGDAWSGGFIANLVTSTISNCYSTAPVNMVGGSSAGGFIGEASGSVIIGVFATGAVNFTEALCTEFGCDHAGGLVGLLDHDGTVTASFASGSVFIDAGAVGGLVGDVGAGAVVSGSYSIGPVASGADFVGGMIGRSASDVEASYWATDSSGQALSAGNAQGAPLAALACPVGPDNVTCLPGVTLYDDWGQYQDEGAPYWDFGTSSELPGLCLDGTLYRVNAAGMLQEPRDCFCDEVETELVTNQGFEANTAGWVGSFGTSITSSTLQAHSGARSLRIANRNLGTWQGAEYNLLGLAAPGETLSANLWTRVVGDPSEPVQFTLRSTCQGGPTVYTAVASGTATNTRWTELSGTVTIPSCNLTQLVIYAEGPRTGIVLHIDDVSIARTTLVCDGAGGPLNGNFLVTTDWGSGYCVELRVTNPNTVPTTDWTATFNLNGATVYDMWNMDRTASTGPITVSPLLPFGQVIAPGASTHSLGFCANRPPGSSALPSGLVVTGVF
jgi:hypothetical protein